MFNFNKVEPKEKLNYVWFSNLPIGETFVCKEPYQANGLDPEYVFHYMKINNSQAVELNGELGYNPVTSFGENEVLIISITVSEVSVK